MPERLCRVTITDIEGGGHVVGGQSFLAIPSRRART